MKNLQEDDFVTSLDPEPHKGRTKELLKLHPEIRELIGKNPYTFLIIILAVSFQLIIAFLLKDSSWWMLLLVAFFVGAFPCHTLFVCIHECAHNLIFKHTRSNLLAGMVANIPLIIPSAVSFKKYHLKHHSYQGVEELDADMPSRWECVLIKNRPFGKALWLLLYPLFLATRSSRIKEVQLFDSWVIANLCSQLVFLSLIVYFWGFASLFYLTCSFFFSIGLHPLGARWIQEHFLTHGNQETKSYYGPLNVVNLNVGYHNEHHDFPSIPWNKLPQLKKMGGTYYSNLFFHTSYTLLLWQFLTRKDLSLYSRMNRTNRG